jgi:hypothetical protein
MPETRKKPSYAKEEFEVTMKGGLSVRKAGKASLMYGVPRDTMQYIEILSGILSYFFKLTKSPNQDKISQILL